MQVEGGPAEGEVRRRILHLGCHEGELRVLGCHEGEADFVALPHCH